ncbi:hypothetical protein HGB25_01520, partial [Candidatus Saccharibacteria bacterium]|nr:hypothetical protein [Candidatus Saccharibacteria bacterium]
CHRSSINACRLVCQRSQPDHYSHTTGSAQSHPRKRQTGTAQASGAIPPAITFLEPDKVFESTANSLRDFIIALDKEKADHLRYKVEGDVVKIFITPYRTTISQDDLEFTQGDYNIELVLALGVENQEHLDVALAAQAGQILKDVTIATICAGAQSSQLSTLAWRNEAASSLSEMVAVLSDSLKVDKTLLDKQTSTAFLTGIVAATDRFSNEKTTSQVMAIAAQLMAAGADQQLIAARLQESHEINALPSSAITESDKAQPIAAVVDAAPAVEEKPVETPETGFAISHTEETSEPVAEATPAPTNTETTKLADEPTADPEPVITSTLPPAPAGEPLLGGILSATSSQAAEDAKRELDEMQNKTILTHSYLSGSTMDQSAAMNSAAQPDPEDGKVVDEFGVVPNPPTSTLMTPSLTITPPSGGLPLPPPLPDFSSSTLPEAPVKPFSEAVVTPPSQPAPAPPAPTIAPANASDPSQFKIPN